MWEVILQQDQAGMAVTGCQRDKEAHSGFPNESVEADEASLWGRKDPKTLSSTPFPGSPPGWLRLLSAFLFLLNTHSLTHTPLGRRYCIPRSEHHLLKPPTSQISSRPKTGPSKSKASSTGEAAFQHLATRTQTKYDWSTLPHRREVMS